MGSTKKDGEYSTERWSGEAKYDCSSCSYDTLSKEDIEEHVRLSHPPQAAPAPAPQGA